MLAYDLITLQFPGRGLKPRPFPSPHGHPFCLKDLPATLGAGLPVSLEPLDSGSVGHRAGQLVGRHSCQVGPVAALAIDPAVRAVTEVGGVQGVGADGALEAGLVVPTSPAEET